MRAVELQLIRDNVRPEVRPNRYLGLRGRLLWRLVLARKLSLLKVWNAAACYLWYGLRRERSAAAPLLINVELSNECNESCLFCRTGANAIHDTNPSGGGQPIPMGRIPFESYKEVLERTAGRLMLMVPYINGEPLLSRDIYRAIRLATDLRVGTLIASNGLLLTREKSRRLLDAGLDFLKVHISGFTQTVHAVQHRRGDVERIKANLREFVRLRAELRAGTVVVLDYILYRHNSHEVEAARAFARELGLLFNVRPGHPRGLEAIEPPQSSAPLPVDQPCDWLWTTLSIDWNGAIYPCCDHVLWSNASRHGTIGCDDVLAAWNGPHARAMRRVHATRGRTPIPICAGCPRHGVKFKW
jgi:sulfatase maturation enzyme AslB (radical SAM superfamily)